MKKTSFLLGILFFGIFTNILTMDQPRPALYTILDNFVRASNWPAIFAILKSTKGVINVNEYTYDDRGMTLLNAAVITKNFLAAKTLLEDYNANPNRKNVLKSIPAFKRIEFQYPLLNACVNGDAPMVQLLLLHKAIPSLKDDVGNDAFEIAGDLFDDNVRNHILNLLNTDKQ